MSIPKDPFADPYTVKMMMKDYYKNDWGTQKWATDPRKGVGLSDHELARIADELGYQNPRWRGVSVNDIRDLIQAVIKYVPGADQRNFEDLFHQAMQCLDEAYADREAEGDAAALLNEWSSILVNG